MDSMRFIGLDFEEIDVQVKPLPGCAITPSILWSQASNGEWTATDLGASQDYYECTVTVFGVIDDMNDFSSWLQAHGRDQFYVGLSSQMFPPNVYQSADITMPCVIPTRDRLQQTFYSPPEDGVQELTLTLRMLAPVFVDTPSPSLDGLVLQEQFEADKSTTVADVFTYSQVLTVFDQNADAGTFRAVFRQDADATIAILRFIMESVRGTSFAFPELPGVQYPFGEAQGGFPFVTLRTKIHSFSISRPDLMNWDLTIEFVQSFEAP